MKYFVYVTFTEASGIESMVESANCTIYKDGSSTDAGEMTRLSNGTFFYPYEYEMAGTYFAKCTGYSNGIGYRIETHVFAIEEDLRPQYINVSPLENALQRLENKVGNLTEESLESLLQELTSYETGVSPLPGLRPITALNCRTATQLEDNLLIVDGTPDGVTGAKISFYPGLDKSKEPYVTYSFNGYWGTYLPAGNYLVVIENGNAIFEDELGVN